MFKQIAICIATISCAGFGCPMGLGKHYTNKPAFFHKNFYATKDETLVTESTTHVVAQQNNNDNNAIIYDRSSS